MWAALPGFLQFHVSAASEICYCNLASSAPEAAWATRIAALSHISSLEPAFRLSSSCMPHRRSCKLWGVSGWPS